MYSEQALNAYSTSLRSLGLVSLREITVGDVRVKFNNNLCFVTDTMWLSVLNGRVSDVSGNRDPQECSEYCVAPSLVEVSRVLMVGRQKMVPMAQS